MIRDMHQEDVAAARKELVGVGHSTAVELEKTVARKLAATLENDEFPQADEGAVQAQHRRRNRAHRPLVRRPANPATSM
jgi:hypothetical protein